MKLPVHRTTLTVGKRAAASTPRSEPVRLTRRGERLRRAVQLGRRRPHGTLLDGLASRVHPAPVVDDPALLQAPSPRSGRQDDVRRRLVRRAARRSGGW